ncbi:MAG TPA: hypothetical protein PKA64_12155, partial [Myxococcota bacterium]|nr:hypothetical protein [Myxococcota bacterium]
GASPQAVEAAFLRRVGLRVRAADALGAVQHVFTHRRLTLEVFVVEGGEGRLAGDRSYDDLAWVDASRPGVPLSRLTEKVLALAGRP